MEKNPPEGRGSQVGAQPNPRWERPTILGAAGEKTTEKIARAARPTLVRAALLSNPHGAPASWTLHPKKPMFLRPLLALLPFTAALLHAAEQPIPVQQEPFHRTVLENATLRVIDVQVPAGQVTKYHVHVLPSVVVYLTKSTNRSQNWGEATSSPRSVSPGESRYAPYDVKALTHQVTNPGPNLFRVLDIELLAPAYGSTAAPLAQNGLRLAWEEPRVRAYNLTLAAGVHAEFTGRPGGYLLIGIAGTAKAKRELRSGDFEFYDPHARLEVRNDGSEPAELVLLEMK